MSDITREEISEKIKQIDELFDRDSKEFAYNTMRLLAIELADEFLGDSE